jgi:hypothetical protein
MRTLSKHFLPKILQKDGTKRRRKRVNRSIKKFISESSIDTKELQKSFMDELANAQHDYQGKIGYEGI